MSQKGVDEPGFASAARLAWAFFMSIRKKAEIVENLGFWRIGRFC
jgi:hypothetical protein